jgi:hypothetical protein
MEQERSERGSKDARQVVGIQVDQGTTDNGIAALAVAEEMGEVDDLVAP